MDKFYNDYYGQLDVEHPTEAGRTFLGDLGARMEALTLKAQGLTESERAKLAAQGLINALPRDDIKRAFQSLEREYNPAVGTGSKRPQVEGELEKKVTQERQRRMTAWAEEHEAEYGEIMRRKGLGGQSWT